MGQQCAAQRRPRQALRRAWRVRELEGPVVEAKRVGDGFELCLVTAGEDWREAPILGGASGELPSEPGRAVNEKLLCLLHDLASERVDGL